VQKTAEPIAMLFGLRIRPWNHVLDGVQIAPREGAILGDRTRWDSGGPKKGQQIMHVDVLPVLWMPSCLTITGYIARG